ncbi:MAG: Uncharacterised protein [Polaribacter sp. SA4-10]|nr:MAG: Uncharacterised protein [Polaribacter sp. SA4-10]
MKLFLSFIAIVFTMVTSSAQEKLPFHEIPATAETYTPQNVLARMVDGLGFRYYWSTEGLQSEDLSYQPKGAGRTCQETIIHLYDLSTVLIRLTKTDFPQKKEKSPMNFTAMRTQTLLNLQALSNRIKISKDVSEFDTTKDGKVTIPLYNLINGPIADAIWHTGQVASFRRSSGNPINSKINQFTGTVSE